MFQKRVKWFPLFDSVETMESKFVIGNTVLHRSMFGQLLLVKHDEKVLAFSDKCPHQNKSLERCKLVDGHIVCPFHQYAFSCADGKGMGMYLPKYELKVENNQVFIGIEKWSFF